MSDSECDKKVIFKYINIIIEWVIVSAGFKVIPFILAGLVVIVSIINLIKTFYITTDDYLKNDDDIIKKDTIKYRLLKYVNYLNLKLNGANVSEPVFSIFTITEVVNSIIYLYMVLIILCLMIGIIILLIMSAKLFMDYFVVDDENFDFKNLQGLVTSDIAIGFIFALLLFMLFKLIYTGYIHPKLVIIKEAYDDLDYYILSLLATKCSHSNCDERWHWYSQKSIDDNGNYVFKDEYQLPESISDEDYHKDTTWNKENDGNINNLPSFNINPFSSAINTNDIQVLKTNKERKKQDAVYTVCVNNKCEMRHGNKTSFKDLKSVLDKSFFEILKKRTKGGKLIEEELIKDINGSSDNEIKVKKLLVYILYSHLYDNIPDTNVNALKTVIYYFFNPDEEDEKDNPLLNDENNLKLSYVSFFLESKGIQLIDKEIYQHLTEDASILQEVNMKIDNINAKLRDMPTTDGIVMDFVTYSIIICVVSILLFIAYVAQIQSSEHSLQILKDLTSVFIVLPKIIKEYFSKKSSNNQTANNGEST